MTTHLRSQVYPGRTACGKILGFTSIKIMDLTEFLMDDGKKCPDCLRSAKIHQRKNESNKKA